MLEFIIYLYLFGLIVYLFIEEKAKVSRIVIFPLLIGIGLNSLIFLLLGYFHIFYSITLFKIISIITPVLLIGIMIFKKKKIKIENDLKGIPIYYVLFLVYFVARFIIIAKSTFINFNNWDELGTYHYISRAIVLTHNTNYMYKLFAPMSYFIGTLTYQFTSFSLSNPRIFGGIFYGFMSLFMYSTFREHNINRHIAALISMIFLISSGEIFVYYLTFYNNIYYSIFILIGLYLYFKYKNSKEFDKSTLILSMIFLISAAITRRESVFHIAAVITSYNLILMIKDKKNYVLKMALEVLIFILIFFSFTHFQKMDVSHVTYSRKIINSAYVAPPSMLENLSKKLNVNYFISNFKNSIYPMYSNDWVLSNQMIFGVAILTFLTTLGLLIKKKKNKYIGFSLFCSLQQFIYYGIIFATGLFLFSVAEFRVAASFSRYMLMVLPMSFIAFGLLFFGKELKEKKERKIDNKINNKSKILLILPAYNEEKSIKKTYDKIIDFNKKNKTNYDVMVINDGSTDSTKKVLEDNNIPHINLICNLGIGGAVQTGYRYAYKNGYDIAIQFDGDGQHDIASVGKLIEPLIKNEADMTIGSRFIEDKKEGFKSSLPRRIGIKIISIVIKNKTNKKIYDTTSGFRAVNRNVLGIYAYDYPTEYPEPISTVKALKKGYKVKEVPTVMYEREAGTSSIKPWKSAYYMINVILTILLMEGEEND